MQLIEQLKNNKIYWKTIQLTSNILPNYILNISVLADALKINNIREQCSAKELQQICDEFNGIFHTSKTYDERHKQAIIKLPAITRINSKITALSTSELYSQKLDVLLSDSKLVQDDNGIISTVGKTWILTPNVGKGKFGAETAFNYGWHDQNGIYTNKYSRLKLWQDVGSAHNIYHSDPSQIIDFVNQNAELQLPTGEIQLVNLKDIYSSDNLWSLVSYDGFIKTLRQTGF
jgi:hypothetical protein